MKELDMQELVKLLSGIHEELVLSAATAQAHLEADLDVVRHLKLVSMILLELQTRPLSLCPGLLCQCTCCCFVAGNIRPTRDPPATSCLRPSATSASTPVNTGGRP